MEDTAVFSVSGDLDIVLPEFRGRLSAAGDIQAHPAAGVRHGFLHGAHVGVKTIGGHIENIKIPLEAFVNKQLSRTDIKVEAYIDEETLNSNKAYTKEEKFVELMNKNPYVKEFQKLFDLYL